MGAFARGALRRRILRDARGLAPSIELPWMPPWGDELDADVVDLLADVRVLQADVADELAWTDDADGAHRRVRLVDAAARLADRCDARAYRATSHALREIAAATRAWESLAPSR